MSKPALRLAMALSIACLAAGCDTQRWIGNRDAPNQPAASAEPRLSPAFSQSGRVEAGVLSPFGPAPLRKGQPKDR